MTKRPPYATSRWGFKIFFIVVVLFVFVVSNSNDKRTSSQNSTPESATSESAASVSSTILPLHARPDLEGQIEDRVNLDDRSALEEETFGNPASAPPDEKRLEPPSTTGLGPSRSYITALPRIDEVKQYLWNVYQRSVTKADSRGDFTWKDAAAAARLGLPIEDYVIGGMDPDFREQLFAAGQAMDAAGIDWTILSAFRDDYRQNLAIGFKARTDHSFHGGSAATGGYGHGCAADVASADGLSNETVWNWLDQHGRHFGLHRPLGRIDPAHVQPTPGWHELAETLRRGRVWAHPELVSGSGPAGQVSPSPAESSSDADVTKEQYNCVRPRPAGEPREEVAHHLNSPITHNHLNSLVARTSISSPERNLKAKWRTLGSVAIRQANLRRPPSDNYSRHVKWKRGLHVAEVCACNPPSRHQA